LDTNMRLKERTAIVTGAGRGIGSGIALCLAQEGADVVVNYAHSADGAVAVVEQIKALGRRAITIQADVSKADQVQAMVAKTVDTFGRVDILVNNAGIDPHAPFLEMTEEQWDWVVDTNLKGSFLCSQAAAREMVKTGGGKIIVVSSIHSIQSYMHITAYAASKGGLNSLTRQLALELAPYAINVNCIAPGAIHVDKFYEVMPTYSPDMFDHEIPLGFIGQAEDIGAVAAFLASDDARFITGQVLFVDGGTSCRMYLGVSEKKTDALSDVETLEKKD
jgi:NAD(P)-dependent dehydrogenase (short-subunit alcohol dehydrogenase family)